MDFTTLSIFTSLWRFFSKKKQEIKLRPHANFDFVNRNFQNGTMKLSSPEDTYHKTSKINENGKTEIIQELVKLDIRSVDCSRLDLSQYNPEKITFDEKTIFPTDKDKMPQHFNPTEIMERHKNPGLGVRSLHKKGLTGKGISVAIIDQWLSPHIEYNDNLIKYKEFESEVKDDGSMHGSAVSSILVGTTCGILPDAKLYYCATQIWNGREQKRYASDTAAALNYLLDLNEKLPKDQKIQVVSVSACPSYDTADAQLWNDAFNRAQKQGLFVLTCYRDEMEKYGVLFDGLGRSVFGDPEDWHSYCKRSWGKKTSDEALEKRTLAFPMENRTLACPQGNDKYVHYSSSGPSWMAPFAAGMFAMARSVDKTITPKQFYETGLKTGTFHEGIGFIVNPVKLIEEVQRAVHTKEKALSALKANQRS